MVRQSCVPNVPPIKCLDKTSERLVGETWASFKIGVKLDFIQCSHTGRARGARMPRDSATVLFINIIGLNIAQESRRVQALRVFA